MNLFWVMALILFGLVSVESESVLPVGLVVVVWLVVSPTQRKLEGTIRAGGQSPVGFFGNLLIVLAFGLFIVAVLTNWRG